MNERTFSTFCETNYPSNKGAFLSGYNENDFSKIPNIIIIDPQISVLSLSVTRVEDVLCNLIRLPLNSIESTLINESFSPAGTVQLAIAESKSLKSKNAAFAEKLIDSATYLHQSNNYEAYREYLKNIKKLIRLKKGFSKNLGLYQRFFLLNELINCISDTEVLRLNKRKSNGHNKSSILQSNAKNLIDELINLTKKIFEDIEADKFFDALRFVDFYIESSVPWKQTLKRKVNSPYAISLKFENFLLSDFITDILVEITKSPLLNNHFEFFFQSPQNYLYIFTHEITMKFRQSKQLTKNQAYLILTKIIEKQMNKPAEISFLPDGYVLEPRLNKGLFTEFNSIAISISRLVRDQVAKSGRFDAERCFFISVILNSYIIRKLDLCVEDMTKCNFYLSVRHMFNRKEQHEAGSQEKLSELRYAKLSMYTQYFSENRKVIDPLVRKGLTYSKSEDNKEYDEILKEISLVISHYNENFDKLRDDNETTHIVLENIYQVSEVGKALLFSILFEQVTLLLNLDNQQKSLCAFVISESILNRNIDTV